MNQQNYTLNTLNIRDIWSQSQKQISKLQPQRQKPVPLNQSSSIQNKIIKQSTFSNGRQTLNYLLPTTRKSFRQATGVPQSVKLLDQYVQRLGFSSMGSVLQRSGDKYLGRIQEKTKNGEYYFRQFPKNSQTVADTPNLMANFTILANKAIQNWNNFIQSQARLGNYLKNIQSNQGRQNMMKKYVKLSNKGTSMLRVLSSLAFLYLNPTSTSKNYLQISDIANIVQVKQILKQVGQPSQIYQNLMNLLKSIQLSPKRLQYIQNFHQNRKNIIRASLKDQQYNEISALLDQQQVYVPQQMVVIPDKKTPQWFKYFNQRSLHQGLIQLTQWNIKGNYLKMINYF